MLVVDGVHGGGHFQGGGHGQVGVIGHVNGGTPKSHDAIAHVFVDGAAVRADDLGQAAEHAVQELLQRDGRHVFRHFGEAAHVAEQHRELFADGAHRVAAGRGQHFLHELRRNVSPKQPRQAAALARFNVVAPT